MMAALMYVDTDWQTTMKRDDFQAIVLCWRYVGYTFAPTIHRLQWFRLEASRCVVWLGRKLPEWNLLVWGNINLYYITSIFSKLTLHHFMPLRIAESLVNPTNILAPCTNLILPQAFVNILLPCFFVKPCFLQVCVVIQ